MKEITRWMVTLQIDNKTFVLNDDGFLSQHHLPKFWLNKREAERAAKHYYQAKVIKWEGR